MTQTEMRVAAVMTAPRYEAVSARNNIQKALSVHNIPLNISGGVFYGQCMQRMLSRLLEAGQVEYALTIDFDSFFSAAHINRLLSLMAQVPGADAMTGIQAKRGVGTILGTRGKDEAVEWNGRPIKVHSAHFGLTVIKLDALAKVPKPWFVSVPDANGEWTDERTDDDVYFWQQWEAAGNSLYLDPGCRIGHMEELVTVYDEQMQLRRIYTKDWDDYSASTVD